MSCLVKRKCRQWFQVKGRHYLGCIEGDRGEMRKHDGYEEVKIRKCHA